MRNSRRARRQARRQTWNWDRIITAGLMVVITVAALIAMAHGT